MIRFGLIGVGGIGSYHRASIERLEKAGKGRLIAVAEPSPLPEQKTALEALGIRWYSDYRSLLDEETELDAVTIATPIPFHYEMASACIHRGLWVNLEKPPVPLVQQLRSLVAADTERRVSVGFQYIGSTCMQELKRRIVAGDFGRIQEIHAGGCWPRLDGYYNRSPWAGRMIRDGNPIFDGPATNALAHLVHNVMFLAGATESDFDVPSEVEGEMYRARPIESYDTACLRGKFGRSGIRFALAVTHATEQCLPFRIDVRGSKGWARLGNDGATLETNLGPGLNRPETTQELLDRNYDAFVDVLRGDRDHFETRLQDTLGYVSATNGMLLSSGGIHDISRAHIRHYTKEEQTGFSVAFLHEAVKHTLLNGKLFSEQGIPWATAKPRPVRLAELTHLLLDGDLTARTDAHPVQVAA
ncbi:Predicted dehydrogenase [Verrucomicrobium sp. GAS474]|uniref:Gfo/Idh/MocA family protein n=1 Tax=Verrucomicrobium sp. GAS474 TaxID=1882831 RepID=UPI00087BA9BF|nr:Gfo/Idh/MocA family oxidoreductase [Verrucomicrobium sp. GAS474]SDU27500.1 Predicted dehydrogenase [Verrucomicrobium sp. GAS474]